MKGPGGSYIIYCFEECPGGSYMYITYCTLINALGAPDVYNLLYPDKCPGGSYMYITYCTLINALGDPI